MENLKPQISQIPQIMRSRKPGFLSSSLFLSARSNEGDHQEPNRSQSFGESVKSVIYLSLLTLPGVGKSGAFSLLNL
jgi:hypothetical protein